MNILKIFRNRTRNDGKAIVSFYKTYFQTNGIKLEVILKRVVLDMNEKISGEYKTSILLYGNKGYQELYYFEKEEISIFDLILREIKSENDLDKFDYIIIKQLWYYIKNPKKKKQTIDIYTLNKCLLKTKIAN